MSLWGRRQSEVVLSQFQPRSSCPVCRAVFRRELVCCPLDGARVVPLPGDPLVGTTIGKHYHVTQVDGDTRTRRIYRAIDLLDEQTVTIQVLYGELASASESRSRFAREARIGALLSHPNVLQILDFGRTAGGVPYLVTPYIETRSLEAVLRQDAPFTEQRARRIALRLASALVHVHSRGVVHLNLKPTTVLVREGTADHVLLTGFHRALREEESFNQLAQPSLGTAPYVAPEVLSGLPDSRSDLFSLGVILYRMLCGQLPFSGSPLQVAVANDADSIPPIRDRVPGLTVSRELESIALKLAARDPNARFADAAAAHRALEA